MDCGFARREEGGAKGCLGQLHVCLQMPHNSELLEDMSEGSEPWIGDCRDQEGIGDVKCGLNLETWKVGGTCRARITFIKRAQGGVILGRVAEFAALCRYIY